MTEQRIKLRLGDWADRCDHPGVAGLPRMWAAVTSWSVDGPDGDLAALAEAAIAYANETPYETCAERYRGYLRDSLGHAGLSWSGQLGGYRFCVHVLGRTPDSVRGEQDASLEHEVLSVWCLVQAREEGLEGMRRGTPRWGSCVLRRRRRREPPSASSGTRHRRRGPGPPSAEGCSRQQFQDKPNMRGGSRRWIIREVENSLRRLGTDYIDLYQVHRPSPHTDVEETLGALSDLVHQGKVLYLGSSSYSGSQIVEAQWVARERNLQRFVTEQPPYSLLVRGIEGDVLPTVLRHGMGTLTYSPLAGGWLSGRWRKDFASSPTSSARPPARFDMADPANQRKLDAVEELALLAEESGLTLIELAVAFVINHPGVTAAIIGPRTMEQLEAFLPAADVTLTADILDRIDKIVAPEVTINPADNSYGAHELRPEQRRR